MLGFFYLIFYLKNCILSCENMITCFGSCFIQTLRYHKKNKIRFRKLYFIMWRHAKLNVKTNLKTLKIVKFCLAKEQKLVCQNDYFIV
jgi:hypothetical protein